MQFGLGLNLSNAAILGKAGGSVIPPPALLTGSSSNTLGSMVNVGSPWRSIMPFADAATTSGDAATLANMFGRDGVFQPAYLAPYQSAYAAQGRGLMPVLDVATFIGSENAPGTTSPTLFNPTALNIDQWVTAAQAMHATYVTPITVHSAGLCYWPTATTAYNITATGIPTVDIVGLACTKFRAAGIAVVPYWSIWQGNKLLTSPTKAQYRNFLELQLRELFALYGPFPAIWCDGGLWHFGSYYPWDNATDMKDFIHSIQPNCVVINNTHVGNLIDSDIIEYEGAVIPSGNTSPAEGVKSILNDGNWFWKPASQPQPLRAASQLNPVTIANGRNATMLVATANDTTGNIPSDQMTVLTGIGAF